MGHPNAIPSSRSTRSELRTNGAQGHAPHPAKIQPVPRRATPHAGMAARATPRPAPVGSSALARTDATRAGGP